MNFIPEIKELPHNEESNASDMTGAECNVPLVPLSPHAAGVSHPDRPKGDDVGVQSQRTADELGATGGERTDDGSEACKAQVAAPGQGRVGEREPPTLRPPSEGGGEGRPDHDGVTPPARLLQPVASSARTEPDWFAHLPPQFGDPARTVPAPDAPLSCAIYTRYSTPGQGLRSEERQSEAGAAIAARMGLAVFRTYSDRGLTGTTTHRRAALTEVLEDGTAGRFSVLFVERLPRLSRDMADLLRLFNLLIAVGVTIYEMSGEQINEIGVLFKGVAAVQERADMLARTYGGRRIAAAAGTVCHRVRFGYMAAPRQSGRKPRRIPHPDRAPVVRLVFDWFDEGLSMVEIAARLSGQQPTPADCVSIDAGRSDPGVRSRWTGEMVRSILDCVLYKGTLIDCATQVVRDPVTRVVLGYVQRPWEEWIQAQAPLCAIVPSAQWNRGYAKRAGIRERNERRTPGCSTHLLTGLIVCGLCSGRMASFAQNGHRRYRCARAVDPSCPGPGRPRVDAVERIALEALVHAAGSTDAAAEYAATYRRARADMRNRVASEAERIKGQIEAIAAELSWTKAHAMTQGFGAERVAAHEAEMNARREALQRALQGLPRLGDDDDDDPLVGLAEGVRTMMDALPFRGSDPASRRLVAAVRERIRRATVRQGPDGAPVVQVELGLDPASPSQMRPDRDEAEAA